MAGVPLWNLPGFGRAAAAAVSKGGVSSGSEKLNAAPVVAGERAAVELLLPARPKPPNEGTAGSPVLKPTEAAALGVDDAWSVLQNPSDPGVSGGVAAGRPTPKLPKKAAGAALGVEAVARPAPKPPNSAGLEPVFPKPPKAGAELGAA